MKKNIKKTKVTIVFAFLIFAVVLGALVARKYETATRRMQPAPQEKPAGSAVLTLFFASNGEGLVREGRELEIGENVEENIEGVVDELISGPLGSLGPTIPYNAKVLGVRLKGDVAEIDFGRELQDDMPSGSSAESMAVYSVVDTVAANFPQVKSVQFLIEGAVAETLKGHVDLRHPIAPNFSLEKQDQKKP